MNSFSLKRNERNQLFFPFQSLKRIFLSLWQWTFPSGDDNSGENEGEKERALERKRERGELDGGRGRERERQFSFAPATQIL